MNAQKKLQLGVNIDHVATLRQARGTSYPDPLEAADLCVRAGAHGITVHLREDRRHIQDADVYALRERLEVPLNLEMANAPDIVRVALAVQPDEVCLVPERREELTTEGGLDVVGQKEALKATLASLQEAGISASLFIDPTSNQVEASADLGVPYIELHTGTYCECSGHEAQKELKKLIESATQAHDLGLGVNAGHGINMVNINGILDIPYLDTLNIGHSIIARAVLIGLPDAVREMLETMRIYNG